MGRSCITNWRFYMAFDDETPIGAMMIAGPTNCGYPQKNMDDIDRENVLYNALTRNLGFRFGFSMEE